MTSPFETILVPPETSADPICPHCGGTLNDHEYGGVICTVCRTRFNIIYEDQMDPRDDDLVESWKAGEDA